MPKTAKITARSRTKHIPGALKSPPNPAVPDQIWELMLNPAAGQMIFHLMNTTAATAWTAFSI